MNVDPITRKDMSLVSSINGEYVAHIPSISLSRDCIVTVVVEHREASAGSAQVGSYRVSMKQS